MAAKTEAELAEGRPNVVDDTSFALFPGITPGITSRGTGQPNVVDDTSIILLLRLSTHKLFY